jgi:integrase
VLHIVTKVRTTPRPPKPSSAKKSRAPRGDGGVTQLASGVWQARIKRYGRDQKRTAPTQAEALALLESMRRTKPTTNTALAKMRLADWLERYRLEQAHTVRLKTRSNLLANSKRAAAILGRIPLNAITPSDLRDFQAKLIEQGYAPTVQVQAWQFLAAALRRAFEDDVIPSNPAAKVKRPRGAKPLRERLTWTAEQCRRALECAKGKNLHLMLSCLLATRVRPNELLGLKWSDIEGDKITIRRTLVQAGRNPIVNPPKTATSHREFYIAPDIQALLEQHRQNPHRAKSADDFVFTTRNGAPRFIAHLRTSLTKLSQKAGITRLTAHELRHTAVTLATLAGADYRQLRRQVGHSGQSMTDHYDHSHLDELERRKLAIPLEVLLRDRLPYDSATASQNSQKDPKQEAIPETQTASKSLLTDGLNAKTGGLK